ncbi:cytochrome c [Methylomonas montana]|uniref:cytochrome c n=1 Tax=Methylomonas montana TaxID=3058963 RepID=UPI0026590734|nr:cytochrome c [Methylomonas montana]WKJ89783.1 cytochrome c [Methylomonas montana]
MKITIILATLFVLSACAGSTSEPALIKGGRSETGRPALHAVRDNQLRTLMDRMDSLMQERFMTELQLDVERRKYSRQIAETAGSMESTVDAIIASMPGLQLSATEKTTFQALAGKLREEIQQLQLQAQQNQIDAIATSVHEINTTCTSCHALFRKLGD